MELIDIGCNLTHDSFDGDRQAVLARAREAGVAQIVVTGASDAGNRAAHELALRNPGVLFSTAGVHPHHAADFNDASEALMRDLSRQPGVVITSYSIHYTKLYESMPTCNCSWNALRCVSRGEKSRK